MDRSYADNCMKKADEIMSSVDNKIMEILTIWKKNYKDSLLEDAADIYSSAGDKYKFMNFLEDAGKAYLKSAKAYEQLAERLSKRHEVSGGWIESAAGQYIDAAIVYKTIDKQKTKQYFDTAARLYFDRLNYKRAGKIYRDLGKIYEDEEDFKKAIKIYEKALECDIVDNNSPIQKNNTRIKIAELAIINNDYEYGSKLYEEVIKDTVYNDKNISMRYYAKEYILKILLCKFIINIDRYDDNDSVVQNMEVLIDKYCEHFRQFESSLEENLVSECIELYKNNEEENIKEYLLDHKKRAVLNPIIARLFSGVIKSISDKIRSRNVLDEVDLS